MSDPKTPQELEVASINRMLERQSVTRRVEHGDGDYTIALESAPSPALTREALAHALHVTGHQQAEYADLGTKSCAGCHIRASKALNVLSGTPPPAPTSTREENL